MTVELLPLCNTGKIAMRDGYTGQYAHIILPFYPYGFWFASGAQYDFPKSQVAQNRQRVIGGLNRPNIFMKDCCSCIGTEQ